MNREDIGTIMEACKAWVSDHHRSPLTIKEANYIRGKLLKRWDDRLKPKPEVLELVGLAHRLANSAIAHRRDAAQRAESIRLAGA